MTHGAAPPWKPLAVTLSLHPQFRLQFIAIGLLILIVTLLSATYYTSFPVIRQFQKVTYENYRNACTQRTNISASVSSTKVNILTRSGSNVRQNTTGFLWNDTRLDILHMKVVPFDKRFKNPCWYESLDDPNPYEGNVYTSYSPSARQVLHRLSAQLEDKFFDELKPKRLRCLPYFLIIGQPKCGTTDLFWKIAKHSDILTPPIKELHWWSRNRQGRRFSYSKLIPFEDYIDMFDEAAIQIEDSIMSSLVNTSGNISLARQLVTGEASVSIFWDNSDWQKFPENKGQSEPLFTIPHYIHHIIPNVKLILMLRDPVERLYSDYLYFHSRNKSSQEFHRAVVLAVDMYNNCSLRYTIRHCVYDLSLAYKVKSRDIEKVLDLLGQPSYNNCSLRYTIRHCVYDLSSAYSVKVRLRVGLYSVYLEDWLKVFPREQLHVLRLEDYSEKPLEYLQNIYRFLDLRGLTEEETAEIIEHPNYNERKESDRELGGMLTETREILQKFYGPFNEELASILGDKIFLWKGKN